MNIEQQTKLENKIKDIELFLNNNRDYSKFDSHTMILERADLQYKLNSRHLGFVLRGDNKYYYAAQCNEFYNNLCSKNYSRWTSKEKVQKEGLSFNKYSINIGYSKYCEDLKRFSSKEEMLGFVIGYNEAVRDQNYKESNNA